VKKIDVTWAEGMELLATTTYGNGSLSKNWDRWVGSKRAKREVHLNPPKGGNERKTN